jgi:hypothetical protein
MATDPVVLGTPIETSFLLLVIILLPALLLTVTTCWVLFQPDEPDIEAPKEIVDDTNTLYGRDSLTEFPSLGQDSIDIRIEGQEPQRSVASVIHLMNTN